MSETGRKKIHMVDLQGQYLRIRQEVDAAISKVLMSTAFIQGPEVAAFGESLAAYTGSAHVVTCGNGTDALQIAMMALGLKPGDEVILPVHTYVATAEVIALLGLKPVFADVRADSFNLDPQLLEGLITERTKAIVPVHLYGQCADMAAILDVASRYNLYVIEDAAQALGATYTFPDGKVRQAGTMGTFGTTSFFPSKNLGAYGDGGALFTQDAELAARAKMIANHGQRKKYYHEVVGINSRLDTIQAAILGVKLKYLTEFQQRRQEAAAVYDVALSGIDGLVIPHRIHGCSHVFHQYTIRVNNREGLRAALEKNGIPTMIYYPVPLHRQEAYRTNGVFPVAEELSRTVLSLPIHTEMDAATLAYICDAIRNYLHG